MPYIEPDARKRLGNGGQPLTMGELTYVLTRAVNDYLHRRCTTGHRCGFQDAGEALGALEATKFELVRRRLAPYEELKRAENGDVYCP
jgi:hypothetical protein